MDVRRLPPFRDVLVIEPDVYGDDRGFFLETWQRDRYAEAGVGGPFVQDNHSRSARGVLRGLHFQMPRPQGKLVQVLRGEVFDVAVDVRIGSPTFGRWAGCRLSDDDHHQMWVPEGFAHGFLALSDRADFHYKCTDFYAPEAERTLRWDDPDVGVDWPIDGPVVSEKDAGGASLEELQRAGHLPEADRD